MIRGGPQSLAAILLAVTACGSADLGVTGGGDAADAAGGSAADAATGGSGQATGGSSAAGADGSGATGGVGGAGGIGAMGGAAGGGVAAGGGAGGVGGASGGGATGGTDGGVADPSQPAISGTRLKAKYVAGPDGSKVYVRGVLFDSQLGVDCTYRLAGDGKLRCLPSAEVSYSLPPNSAFRYSDANCTMPVVLLSDLPGVASGCNPVFPKYVQTYEATGYCEPKGLTHMYSVGSTVENIAIYDKSGTTCVGGTLVRPVIALTAQPAASFVEGSLVTM